MIPKNVASTFFRNCAGVQGPTGICKIGQESTKICKKVKTFIKTSKVDGKNGET